MPPRGCFNVCTRFEHVFVGERTVLREGKKEKKNEKKEKKKKNEKKEKKKKKKETTEEESTERCAPCLARQLSDLILRKGFQS